MNITKELLEQKKQEYVSARDQLTANAAVFSGAIQDIDFWLAKLNETEPTPPAPPVETPPTAP